MMKLTAVGAIATFALLITAPAYAADNVAGRWIGETENRNGTVPVFLELNGSGTALTGRVATGDNPTVEIHDGSASGSKVSFSIIRSGQGVDAKVVWNGEVKGDELTFDREITGTPGNDGPLPPVTFKRAK